MAGPYNLTWYEVYRPTSLDEMWLEPETRSMFEFWLETGLSSSLLLAGPTGVGKTTLARILLDELASEWIWKNTSSERGIQVIRDEVIPFAKGRPPQDGGKRFVVLEEADRLTGEAVDALREPIERTSDRTSFVPIANDPKHSLVKYFRHRHQLVEMPPVPSEDRIGFLTDVLEREEVTCPPDVVKRLADSADSLRVIYWRAEKLAAAHWGRIPSGAELPGPVMETVRAVTELTTGTDDGVSQAQLAAHLDLAQSTVSERVSDAKAQGLIEDRNPGEGTAAELTLTRRGHRVISEGPGPNGTEEAA